MNFSHKVKHEILSNLSRENSVKDFLQGVVISSFEVFYNYSHLSAEYISESAIILNLLVKELHQIDKKSATNYSIYAKKLKSGIYRQYLHLDNAEILLDYLKLTDGYKKSVFEKKDFSHKARLDTALDRENLLPYIDKNNQNAIANKTDNSHFLAGVIASKGAISDPNKAYHLEISLRDKTALKLIKKMLIEVLDSDVKEMHRKTRSSIYIKEKDAIADILSIVGAQNNRLDFEEIIVEKDMKNKVMRIYNCDNANIKRASATSIRQTAAIKKIDKHIGLDNLDPKLKVVAALRLNNPGSSLTELSELMEGEITKSGINHRLKKLEQLAAEID